MSDDPEKAELEARIVAAARRWYASTNESALAEAVSEYERLLRRRAAVPLPVEAES